MKKFILLIDSLVQTFSIIEAGSEIAFKYQNKNNLDVFQEISIGDIILGCFSDPSQMVKCVFEVTKVLDLDSIVLLKKLEVSIGAKIDSSIIELLENNTIIEINDECYSEITNKMLAGIENKKELENIFNGFSSWLTSYDNPDYTGKEKYSGYPRCLERLVQFMAENKLIEDSNLNDNNIDKFIKIKTVYDNSEKAKEFDSKLSYYAGIAALKKYIKYIEFLSSKKHSQLETKGSSFDVEVICENIPTNLSVAELGNILANMYNNASQGNQSNAIRMFGVKYGGIITDKGYTASAITKASGINSSYDAEVSKGISIYKSIRSNEYGVHFVEKNSINDVFEEKNDLVILPRRTRKVFELNSILYGAPGTGKTYATAKYALAITEGKPLEYYKDVPREDIMSRYNQLVKNEQVVFTTFHQNYGYEDFIQGIRPDTSTQEMRFKTVDGVFKKIAEKAMDEPEKDFVIIIDEINRANISKVFGELITLIEDDKRWGEENAVSVALPSGEIFAVPNNLYIVGTMNSADKSISLIDTALRRRFDFVEFVPDLTLISDAKLNAVLKKLNEGIEKELNSTDLLVGHSYFINKNADDICNIMNRNIIPLLYEYFFDNKNKVEAQLKSALEGLDVEIVSNAMGRIKIKKKEV